MTKAKNGAEFEERWNSEIDTVNYLCHSLPSKKALELLNLTKQIREYIKLASNHVYGECNIKDGLCLKHGYSVSENVKCPR